MELNTVKIAPAKGIGDLYKLKYKVLPFDDRWQELIGCPEVRGSWIVWGLSGNGKTSFMMQLTKYLCGFQKVLYESLEEGDSLSFQSACKRVGMEAVKRNFQYQQDSYDGLMARLAKKRSANIVIIDSLQHLRINKAQYYNLLRRFPNKLFIFVSHARGQEPKGELADEVKYNSNVKLRVSQFLCTPVEATRYGGNVPFVIWEEGYRNAQLKLN